MTPDKAGIPLFSIPDGRSYQIADRILEGDTWIGVQQDGDDLGLLRGHVLVDFDHDVMIHVYPYRWVGITARAGDEFARMRDPLPRWTRTRWLVMEYVKGGLKNGLLTVQLYDYRAGKPVSATCRGIKRISRLMASGQCAFLGVKESSQPISPGSAA